MARTLPARLYDWLQARVPIGPAIQYTNEKPDAPITLYVYEGANGEFALYEDDGISYGYERGESTRIAMKYDDAAGELLIGAREGTFPGMPAKRVFNVRWIAPGEANARLQSLEKARCVGQVRVGEHAFWRSVQG